MNKTITVAVPSTIGNVGVGFDVMGMALEHVAEEVTVQKRDDGKLVIVEQISEVDLPSEAEKNAATVAVQHFLQHIGSNQGFSVSIKKFVRPGSGLGSSAASSAGAVFAANELLGSPLSRKELLPFAMEGERIACGSPIADNVSPAMLGGIVLIHKGEEIDLIELPYLDELYCSLIYPAINIKTEDARNILDDKIDLQLAITQWGSLATFVSAIYTANYDLIGKSLRDHVVEPMRAKLIPGFAEVKSAAMQAGALGCSISGAGPSIFALSRGKDTAAQVLQAMETQLDNIDMPYQSFVSGVNQKGVQIKS